MFFAFLKARVCTRETVRATLNKRCLNVVMVRKMPVQGFADVCKQGQTAPSAEDSQTGGSLRGGLGWAGRSRPQAGCNFLKRLLATFRPPNLQSEVHPPASGGG